jgi:hypothetical protein
MSTRTLLSGFAPAAIVGLIVVGGSAASGPALAQRVDPGVAAVDRCEQELAYMIGQEVGGNRPDTTVDDRSVSVRQVSAAETGVRGNGQYRRDNFDRGRPYSFDCVVNVRTGRTRVTYKWSGMFGGSADDAGYMPAPSYRQSPGNGQGRAGAGPGSGYTPDGRVFFSGGVLSRSSGKGLDVQNEGTGNRANVQMWDFGDKPNQSWDVIDLGRGEFSIVNQGSNKALDVANSNGQEGANVQQLRWHNGANQRWRLERVGGGFYQIVSVASGQCLDVQSKSMENGANVQVWSCSGQPNQQWRLGR